MVRPVKPSQSLHRFPFAAARPGRKPRSLARPVVLAGLLALCLATAGCDFIPAEPQWNFLIYMAADNNLEEYAIADFNELEQIGSTNAVAVFVLIDRHPAWDTSNGDWTGTRLYRITRDSDPFTINSELIADYGELAMDDPATLRDFIIACHDERPAPRTCLTLWNHGAGVFPRSVAAPTLSLASVDDGVSRAIARDDTSGGAWLTTDEIAQALSQARAAAGERPAVINMDACIMQMIEIAWEWRDEADYLVGSEANSPAVGNNYDLVLGHLNSGADMDARELAVLLVDDFYASYRGSPYDRTYSAVSLGAEFDALATSFTAFAAALHDTAQLSQARAARAAATDFAIDLEPEYVDLYSFAMQTRAFMTDPAVTQSAGALMAAIEEAVVNHCATNAYLGTTHGLSVLLPETAVEWADYSDPARYPAFPLCLETDWDEFIAGFVQ